MKFKILAVSLLTIAAGFVGYEALGSKSAYAIDLPDNLQFPVVDTDLGNIVRDRLRPRLINVPATCEAILDRVPLVDTAACGAKRSQCVQDLNAEVADRIQSETNQCLAQTEPEANCVRGFLEAVGQDSPEIRRLIDQSCPRVPVDPASCVLGFDRQQNILNDIAQRFESELAGICVAEAPENPDVDPAPPAINPGQNIPEDIQGDSPEAAKIVDGLEKTEAATGGCSLNGIGGGFENLFLLAIGLIPGLIGSRRQRSK